MTTELHSKSQLSPPSSYPLSQKSSVHHIDFKSDNSGPQHSAFPGSQLLPWIPGTFPPPQDPHQGMVSRSEFRGDEGWKACLITGVPRGQCPASIRHCNPRSADLKALRGGPVSWRRASFMEKGQCRTRMPGSEFPDSVSRPWAVILNASMSAPVKMRLSAPSTSSCGGEEAVNKIVKYLTHLALS